MKDFDWPAPGDDLNITTQSETPASKKPKEDQAAEDEPKEVIQPKKPKVSKVEADEKPPADEGDPKAADVAKAKKNTQSGTQKKIDKAVKKAGEEGRRADAAEKENQRLRNEIENLKRGEEPLLEDFDDPDDFEKAHKVWKDKEPEKIVDSNPIVDSALKDIQLSAEMWEEKPDNYNDLISKGDFDLNERMVIAISELNDPAQFIYYLANHPEEASKLARIKTESRLVNQIDQMVDEISAPPEPESKKLTEADDPINPLAGNDAAKPNKSLSEMSQAEYNAHMNKLERDNGKFDWPNSSL